MAHPAEESADGAQASLLASASALVEYLASRLAASPPPPAASLPDLAMSISDEPPRQAAVLVPLYARGDRPYLLFTQRSATLTAHRGEISFPGGSQDPGDLTLAATALREAREELGIAPESVQILGALGPVFTVVSNYLITPIVGWLGAQPITAVPNPAEVAEVIEASLADLADPAIFHAEQWMRNGRSHPVYFYDLGPYRIWGATARILHEFLELLPT
jgi:8-oxo-dGTP pyrophosphatase MutT (NUDIX family)